MTIAWTENLNFDWKALCDLWVQSPHVLQAEVGPRWEMPPQHKACIEFADYYPDSKKFLIAQLQDPDPRIAAYAFKCLARVTDIKRSDIPSNVFNCDKKVTTLNHSFIDETTIGEFIGRYFDLYGSQDDLIEEQKRTVSWQENELAEYKKNLENESDDNAE